MKLPKIDPAALVGRDETGQIKAARITRTGKLVDVANPDPASIDIESIASGLAYQCRFTGQTRVYYDVARHSILVSYLAPPKLALKALLHDADESLISDLARPVKAILPEYKALQKKVLGAVLAAFDMKLPLEPEIHHADQVAVAIEQAILLPNCAYWPHILSAQQVTALLKELALPMGFFLAANPELSRVAFLRRFNALRASP